MLNIVYAGLIKRRCNKFGTNYIAYREIFTIIYSKKVNENNALLLVSLIPNRLYKY